MRDVKCIRFGKVRRINTKDCSSLPGLGELRHLNCVNVFRATFASYCPVSAMTIGRVRSTAGGFMMERISL
jgi:hypothetical protein